MNRSLFPLWILTVVALAAGCASTQDTTNLLSAAGFHIVSATTPQQQSELKTLAPGKVTRVPRNGTDYYVFPDPKQQALYVGQSAQYQQYQKLRLQKQLADENLAAAEMGSTTDWATWGPWDAPVVVPVRPVIRR